MQDPTHGKSSGNAQVTTGKPDRRPAPSSETSRRLRPARPGIRPTSRRAGYTLIEMIGVLSIIVILGSLVAQVLITRLVDAARRAERVSMLNMGRALRTAVLVNRELTDAGGLADTIALELQIPPDRARHTPQGFLRRYLVDPALRLGTSASQTVPYFQTSAGSIQPVAPRVMIVSSLASDVPENLDFDETWALAEGQSPEDLPVNPEDVFIQRIDLGSLFHRVVLNNSDWSTDGQYSIDGFAVERLAPSGQREAWFLDGTTITLYYATGELQAREIVHEDVSYVHEKGKWGNRLLYGRESSSSFGQLVDAFLTAPPPPDAKFGATQQSVIDEFYIYLRNYAIWSFGDPPAILPFDGGGSSSDQQVPSQSALLDSAARMKAFTNNLID